MSCFLLPDRHLFFSSRLRFLRSPCSPIWNSGRASCLKNFISLPSIAVYCNLIISSITSYFWGLLHHLFWSCCIESPTGAAGFAECFGRIQGLRRVSLFCCCAHCGFSAARGNGDPESEVASWGKSMIGLVTGHSRNTHGFEISSGSSP